MIHPWMGFRSGGSVRDVRGRVRDVRRVRDVGGRVRDVGRVDEGLPLG